MKYYALLFSALAVTGVLASADLDLLRWDEVQFVKTHNSYHLRMEKKPLPDVSAPNGPSLTKQLQAGVRAIEIDLQYPVGDDFPVFHEPTYDDRSSCASLRKCLGEAQEFLTLNPEKGPIFFHIESKQKPPTDFSSEQWRLFDKIASSMFEGQVVKPSVVKGSHADLASGVAAKNWPTLGATRGKVAFILDKSYPSYGKLSDIDFAFQFGDGAFHKDSEFESAKIALSENKIVRFWIDDAYMQEINNGTGIQCYSDVLDGWFNTLDQDDSNLVTADEIVAFIAAFEGPDSSSTSSFKALTPIVMAQCEVTEGFTRADLGCFMTTAEKLAQTSITKKIAEFPTFGEVSYRRNRAIRDGFQMLDTDHGVKPAWADAAATIDSVYWVQLDSPFVCNPVRADSCDVPPHFRELPEQEVWKEVCESDIPKETPSPAADGASATCPDDPSGALKSFGSTCKEVANFGCETDLSTLDQSAPEGSVVKLLCPGTCNNCPPPASTPVPKCPDDPSGALKSFGSSCEEVANFGCETDLSTLDQSAPEGSVVKLLCPGTCNNCPKTEKPGTVAEIAVAIGTLPDLVAAVKKGELPSALSEPTSAGSCVQCGVGTAQRGGECVGISATCAGLWQGAIAHYRTTDPCQCNSKCGKFGNCCADYAHDHSATAEGFCVSKNCPDYYEPTWDCQCNSLCQKFGNCCGDVAQCMVVH